MVGDFVVMQRDKRIEPELECNGLMRHETMRQATIC